MGFVLTLPAQHSLEIKELVSSKNAIPVEARGQGSWKQLQEATALKTKRQMMNSFVKNVDLLDFHIRDKYP